MAGRRRTRGCSTISGRAGTWSSCSPTTTARSGRACGTRQGCKAPRCTSCRGTRRPPGPPPPRPALPPAGEPPPGISSPGVWEGTTPSLCGGMHRDVTLPGPAQPLRGLTAQPFRRPDLSPTQVDQACGFRQPLLLWLGVMKTPRQVAPPAGRTSMMLESSSCQPQNTDRLRQTWSSGLRVIYTTRNFTLSHALGSVSSKP